MDRVEIVASNGVDRRTVDVLAERVIYGRLVVTHESWQASDVTASDAGTGSTIALGRTSELAFRGAEEEIRSKSNRSGKSPEEVFKTHASTVRRKITMARKAAAALDRRDSVEAENRRLAGLANEWEDRYQILIEARKQAEQKAQAWDWYIARIPVGCSLERNLDTTWTLRVTQGKFVYFTHADPLEAIAQARAAEQGAGIDLP